MINQSRAEMTNRANQDKPKADGHNFDPWNAVDPIHEIKKIDEPDPANAQ